MRLLAYRPNELTNVSVMVSWQTYNVDPDGTLRIVDLPEERLGYVAVGELSGEIPSLRVGSLGPCLAEAL